MIDARLTAHPAPAHEAAGPPLDVHAALVVEAGRALRRHGAGIVQRYPARYDPLVLPFEPVNLWRVLRQDGPHLLDRTAVPGLYRRMLVRRHPQLAEYVSLCVHEQEGSGEQWRALLGARLVEKLVGAGLLSPVGDRYVSRLRFVPYDDRVYVSDGTDKRVPKMVWLGKDTMHLLAAMRRRLAGRRFARGLEVGSGSGLLTIELSQFCDAALGVDINPRAVTCGTINARINDASNVEFRRSDLYAHVSDTYDIVIANPPYVFEPPDRRPHSLHSHGGEEFGIDLQLRLLAGLADALRDGGIALVLCCSPVVAGIDLLPHRIRTRFAGLPLQFEFEPLFNNTPSELLDYHDACGIRYTWAYLVSVTKRAPASLVIRRPSPWTSCSSWAYRTAVRVAHRRRRHQEAGRA